MDPLKNNACLKKTIQNTIDKMVKAMQNHPRPQKSSGIFKSHATAIVRKQFPDSELPFPWWLLTPELAMYHGMATEIDDFHDGWLPNAHHKTEGMTLEAQQEHLKKEIGLLNSRINALMIDHLNRQRLVRSSRKRQQLFSLHMYKESHHFQCNGLYDVATRLQFSRFECDILTKQLNALSARRTPEDVSRQMNNDAFSAEKSEMEA